MKGFQHVGNWKRITLNHVDITCMILDRLKIRRARILCPQFGPDPTHSYMVFIWVYDNPEAEKLPLVGICPDCGAMKPFPRRSRHLINDAIKDITEVQV